LINADSIRSLYIGYGSNCELETQVLLSGGLGYVEAGRLAELIDKIAEVERMLKALIKSLEKNTWPLESLPVSDRLICFADRIFYN